MVPYVRPFCQPQSSMPATRIVVYRTETGDLALQMP